MDRFRVAFAGLLAFALVTTSLAGWAVIGPAAESLNSLASGGAAVPAAGMATSSTTTQSSSSISASNSTVSSAVGGVTSSVSTTTASVSSPAGVPYSFVGGSTYGVSGGVSLLRQVQGASIFLAPVSWVLLGGAWIWRGRVRSKYTEMGFGSDVFELFMKMKGGATRIKVLNTLTTPKDRLQLAEELGVDWKTVDRHVQILNRYGFVREQGAYGTVRMYEVTPMGRILLNLFEDLEQNDGPVARQNAGGSTTFAERRQQDS